MHILGSKSTIIKWAFLLIGPLIINYQISLAGNSSPVLKIETFAHHDEPYWQGQMASHSFNVNNIGNAELRIVSVAPD